MERYIVKTPKGYVETTATTAESAVSRAYHRVSVPNTKLELHRAKDQGGLARLAFKLSSKVSDDNQDRLDIAEELAIRQGREFYDTGVCASYWSKAGQILQQVESDRKQRQRVA